VSAVGLRLIKFQCFEKIPNFFAGFFSINSAIAVALCADREMNVYPFSDMFSAFIFNFEGGNIIIQR